MIRATFPRAAVPACPVELRLGRTAWTREDYLAEGRRQFDAAGYADAQGKPSPWSPGSREEFAAAFAQVAMPKLKADAERAAKWAAMAGEAA